MKSYIKTILFAIVVFALLWYFSDTTSALDFVKKPEIVFALAALLIAILFNGKIVKNLHDIQHEKLSEEEKMIATEDNWFQKTYKKLVGSKPIEEEHEIILDHNYDGIKELDNDLPPWWKYSFYISIIFAIVYLTRFMVFHEYTQFDELDQEYKEAAVAIAKYKETAKDLIDINSVELLTEASDLKKGKAIFEANCVACHKADGGGGIGPNLTDNHWILGGGIKNVFHTVTEGGRDGKGMIAWKTSLKPSEIQEVASYVISLQGTTPAAPKAPQGDIVWPEGSVAPATTNAEATTEDTLTEKEVSSTDSQEVKALTSKTDLANGKKIFEANCAACHKADGGGLVGPNLTDKNWVLGGGMKNIVHTITNGGRSGKGMIPWKSTLKPQEINQVASYILTLQGTNPAGGKAPEGDIWKE